jgi:hypothetical protein
MAKKRQIAVPFLGKTGEPQDGIRIAKGSWHRSDLSAIQTVEAAI